jgi:predicted sulfurtransferase
MTDKNPFITLLYYQYVSILELESLREAQEAFCVGRGLRGRIRISPEGLNGTLDGTQDAIDAYIQLLDEDKALSPTPIHWKLGKTSESLRFQGPISVKICKEVVSLDLDESTEASLASTEPGCHLSPNEWHAALSRAVELRDDDTVLIDVRNMYETRIGYFECDPTISKLDPCSRKFSDFSKFVQDNAENLHSKKVYMYCTGGVRCEKASRYLRQCVPGAKQIFQLHGGIHSYQESFPEGGFFRGKNFTYDPRIAVPSAGRKNDVVGACMLCLTPYDDYTPQWRCQQCRMLVLVCDSCRIQVTGTGGIGEAAACSGQCQPPAPPGQLRRQRKPCKFGNRCRDKTKCSFLHDGEDSGGTASFGGHSRGALILCETCRAVGGPTFSMQSVIDSKALGN